MLPYWLLFALFAAGALFTSGRPAVERHGATLLFTLACIATVVMIGFRVDVGGDRYTYLEFYKRMNLYPLSRAIGMGDPSYALLNWTVRRADLGMWLVNTVCAAIFVAGLGKFALRQPNPWLAMLIAVPYLIIVVAMGYTRQAAALGLRHVGPCRLRSRRGPSVRRVGARRGDIPSDRHCHAADRADVGDAQQIGDVADDDPAHRHAVCRVRARAMSTGW